MNRILLTGMLCVAMVSIVDASPRDRRARRRVSRRPVATARPATTQSYYNNYRPAQSAPSVVNSPSVSYSQPGYSQQSYSQSSYTPSNVQSYGQPVIAPSYTEPQRVTTYKPVVSDSVATSAPIAMADSAVAPIGTSDGNSAEVQASALQPVPDVMPTLKSNESLSSGEPFCASCTVIPAGQSFNSALAELNGLRAQKGLPALVEDPALSAIAYKKASIQANAGTMYHPGGSMGGARFEGVGMGPRFTSCYQDATNVRYAGAATVVGRNGQRYHCLLVK